MCEALAGVRLRLPLAASRGIPQDGGHFSQPRGAERTARRQWAFHDPVVGTGFDLGCGYFLTRLASIWHSLRVGTQLPHLLYMLCLVLLAVWQILPTNVALKNQLIWQ